MFQDTPGFDLHVFLQRNDSHKADGERGANDADRVRAGACCRGTVLVVSRAGASGASGLSGAARDGDVVAVEVGAGEGGGGRAGGGLSVGRDGQAGDAEGRCFLEVDAARLLDRDLNVVAVQSSLCCVIDRVQGRSLGQGQGLLNS